MEFIAHRINTIAALQKIPSEYGVELDLRDNGARLILQHDPFKPGDDFEEYLRHYDHGTMVLNIKSERIEYRVLDLIRSHNIASYFFLDSSFPMIYALTETGEKNVAVRFSELEGLDTVMAMAGRADWVWVDCFTRLPIDAAAYRRLKGAGFKLCLVSPELQGRPEDILTYKEYLARNEIYFDAVCTKDYGVEKWSR
ncbi:MAG: hypothetical protein HQK57_07305 [Deltaproteobacteria bacterium]|nr:hypothetical protein [Deltaproteobacteria bacterium]MBF0524709.1 hypothetical protein [Deltaproteobacteria bacterium]